SFDRVSKSSGIFDVDKLNWMNNIYIKNSDLEALTHLSKPFLINSAFTTEETFDRDFTWLKRIVEVLRERLNKLEDLGDYTEFFKRNDVAIEDDEAKEIIEMAHVPEILALFIDKMKAASTLDEEAVKGILKEIQKETGHKGKNLFMPVRVAITGQVHGPDIAIVTEILGKSLTEERIQYCLKHHCIQQ
ncbi:MAG TPA: glutamate--tRNA ligase, partial [Fusibacter sp.]|nr:glutamate--tRNA ligase [Fusibacter sp.]